jgi:hypothetical protein
MQSKVKMPIALRRFTKLSNNKFHEDSFNTPTVVTSELKNTANLLGTLKMLISLKTELPKSFRIPKFTTPQKSAFSSPRDI